MMSHLDHSLFYAELDACMSDDEHGWFAQTTYDRHAKMALQEAMNPLVLQKASLNVSSEHQRPLKTSKCGFRKNRPAPLFTPTLPKIPTVSSPFFPNGLQSTTIPLDVPDLSWGTTMTSPSYPSFLASSTAASVHHQHIDVWSPTSDLPTADILAVYDELTQTPPPSQPENPNHPYVPWTASFRAMHILRPDDQSPHSPTTQITHISRGSPVSRSGAAAPEPPESPDVPRCGYTAGRWCRFAANLPRQRRPRSPRESRFNRRVLKKRRKEKENGSAAFTLSSALKQSSRILTLGTAMAPGEPAPPARPESVVYVLDPSPIAPSFTSTGTSATLRGWLDLRRQSTGSGTSGSIELEDYERRGSWLHATYDDEDEDTHSLKAISEVMMDSHDKARRRDAIRHGWICGFTDCNIHPRDSGFDIHDEEHESIRFGVAH